MTTDELEGLKAITEGRGITLWISRGGFISGEIPELATSWGLLRSMRTENPSWKQYGLDFPTTSNDTDDSRLILDHLNRLSSYPGKDYEFVVYQGLVQVSRVEPDRGLNELYNSKHRVHNRQVANYKSFEADIQDPGLLDTIYFRETHTTLDDLPPNKVEVRVEALGLNMKVRLSAAPPRRILRSNLWVCNIAP
jgi:hypothetical protein